MIQPEALSQQRSQQPGSRDKIAHQRLRHQLGTELLLVDRGLLGKLRKVEIGHQLHLDPVQHLRLVIMKERFVDKISSPEIQRLLFLLHRGQVGHDQYRDIPFVGIHHDRFQELQAGHLGHVYIRQNQIDRGLGDRIDRFLRFPDVDQVVSIPQ